MLLGRLRVRQKLVLLVLPLLVLAIASAVPLVAGRVLAAEHSADAARVVQRAVRIGELVQEVQQERLASLGFLSGDVSRDRVVARTTRVQELADQLNTDYSAGDDDLAVVLRGINSTAGLGQLRNKVLDKSATGLEVYQGFTDVTTGLIEVLRLVGTSDLRSTAGRQQLALDSIIRHDEATAAEGSALFIETGGRITARIIGLASRGLALENREENVFKQLAQPSAIELYEQVEDGQSSTRLNTYLSGLVQSPATRLDAVVPPDLQPRVESLTSLSRLVETRVAAQAVDEANRSARTDRWLAGLGIGIALLLLAGATVLSVFIPRSIARPLRRLTASADEVADVAQQELVRVADTDDPQAAVPQLRPVRVDTSDELGELAQAFNRVQQVASNLVERQLVSRQNVATMFGNVGRRTQNLVGRQLAMIDSLERNEQDPALLDRLYRLDHVSTRLRRNANSLVVLSGATDQQITGEPLTVADTIRSALGEIEGFQRVRLGEVDSALLTPHVTPDVTLLLAELLENGTSFSPPHTEVEVDAQSFGEGDVTIRIVDHGLGMTTDQLTAENGRLVSRERLDLAPTDVLGLFVVGRLARRHGIEVLLAPTPGTGVTAEVRVPARHVVRPEAPAVVTPALVRTKAPAPVAVDDGSGRGWWDTAGPDAPDAGPDMGPGPVDRAGAPPAAGSPGGPADGAAAEPGQPADGASTDRGNGHRPPAVGTGFPWAVNGGTPPSAPEAEPAGARPPDFRETAQDADEPVDPVAGSPTAEADTRTPGSTTVDPPGTAAQAGTTPVLDPHEDPHEAAAAGSAADPAAAESAVPGPVDPPAAPAGEHAVAEAPVAGAPVAAGPTGSVAAELAAAQAGAPGSAAAAPAGAGGSVSPQAGAGGSVSPQAGASGPGPAPTIAGDPAATAPAGAGASVGGPVVGGGPDEAAAPREVARPRGAAGMVRRVRGAQHPDTGAPRRPEPPVSAPLPSAEDARREVEDFEEGVRRALHETGADGAGFVVDAEADDLAPWTHLDPDDPESAQQTRALVEEFEDGVRRALARLDEVAARPAPDPTALFERPTAGGAVPDPRRQDPPVAAAAAATAHGQARNGSAQPPPVRRPAEESPVAARPGAVAHQGSAPQDSPFRSFGPAAPGQSGDTEELPPRLRPPVEDPRWSEGVPLVPRRLDAGSASGRSAARPMTARGRPDPRPLERRRPPDGPPSTRSSPRRPDQNPGPAPRPDQPTSPVPSAGPAAPPNQPTPSPPADAGPAPRSRRPDQPTSPVADAGPVAPPGRPEQRSSPVAGAGPVAPPGRSDQPTSPPADTAPAPRSGPADQPTSPVPDAAPAPQPVAVPASPDGGQSPGIAGTRPNEASPNGSVRNASDAGKLDASGDAGLVRRVPGAQMPAGARAGTPGSSAPAPTDPAEPDVFEEVSTGQDVAEQDAIAARSLVEEFEAGVQRALQLGDDRGTAGTAETDEDGVR